MFSFVFLRDGHTGPGHSQRRIQSAGLNLARTLVRAQLVVAVAIIALGLGFGVQQAIAAGLGCSAALIPYTLFVYLAFAFSGARMAQATVRAFYLGEAIKIFSSVIILVVALLLFRPHAEWVMLAYGACMVPVWLGPLFLKTK
ncbi:hypothetical protein GCM10011369_03450 [Neiella marina]|uniref:ATP synthase protein I n=1 Tax=Neiella marina TaxID=508461 RepID=A0A8J2U286_9GAMM|nr:ATP synthase subunit I [Neiella marina]GGA65319.1 hypothetical protein GCM10011369_03450 [Neiella marina]